MGQAPKTKVVRGARDYKRHRRKWSKRRKKRQAKKSTKGQSCRYCRWSRGNRSECSLAKPQTAPAKMGRGNRSDYVNLWVFGQLRGYTRHFRDGKRCPDFIRGRSLVTWNRWTRRSERRRRWRFLAG